MTRDNDYTPEEAAALEAVGHASAMASNDPNWQADMAELRRNVDAVANEVDRVTLVDRGERGGHHIEVDLTRRRHRPAAQQTAARMAELFEASLEVRREGAPAPGDTGRGASFAQPPRHTHYKDDRKDGGR